MEAAELRDALAARGKCSALVKVTGGPPAAREALNRRHVGGAARAMRFPEGRVSRLIVDLRRAQWKTPVA